MPSTTDIIRQREARRTRRKRSLLQRTRRSALILFAAASLIVSLAAVLAAVLYADLARDLPSLERLPALLDPETGVLASPTAILDRTGSVTLAVLGNADLEATYLTIDSGAIPEIAPDLVQAVIASADPGFWTHPGFYLSTFLSPEKDTLPIRLVSDLLFWQEPQGLRRSVRERLMAAQIVSTYGREQVLEWYLNSANFGYETFGAEAAARLYFGKSAGRLDLAEAAVLAAVARTPDLNPFDTPDLALARRNQTIREMLSLGLITEEESTRALAASLGAQTAPEQRPDIFSAFVRAVQAEAARNLPLEVLARGGFSIVTTLDAGLQAGLSCTLLVQLERLTVDTAALPEDCAAARLLPSPTGVSHPGAALAGEGLVLDPRTGQVLALVAAGPDGAGWAAGTHPPGSLLAPYVYLSAFTRGLSPATLVWDIPASMPGDQTAVPNLDGEFHGPMRIRTALAGDYLAPTLQLLSQFSSGSVWGLASLSGLPSLADATDPLLLDGGGLALMEMVHGFGALSTQGVLIGYPDSESVRDPVPLLPTTVLRIEEAGGRAWLDRGPPGARPVMSAALAYLLTNILSDESARWPALGHPNVLEIGRPAGVKLGFTQSGSDVWTVGYTPQVAVGIWLGLENPGIESVAPLAPQAAGSVWHAVTKYATRDQPPDGWSPPQGVVEVDVCDPSGLLPTPDCPLVVAEVFLQGNEPVYGDTLYRRFEINRETGLLATVFTPPALIEEKVFFVPPPEALSWAQAAGLEVPPENYDLVSRPPAVSQDARITAPEMFVYVQGEVEIRGTAAGAGFRSFSVQVGQGLNPQQWLQLGVPSETPVTDGRLAVWDTAGAGGLYAIRMLVVREDNLVETHVVQVTVDNQPPDIVILSPEAGQEFSYPLEAPLTVQLDAGDNLGLRQVDLYLDNRLIRSLVQPPYAVAIELSQGGHTLRAVAIDLAGNSSESELVFSVVR